MVHNAMGSSSQTGHLLSPQHPLLVPSASVPSPPSYHNPYFFDLPSDLSDAGTRVDLSPDLTHRPLFPIHPKFYSTPYQLAPAVYLDTSVDPGIDSNLHSNLMNYPHCSSDIDTRQYPFSSHSVDNGPCTPSSSSDGTGQSATTSDSMTILVLECRARDPVRQQLAYAILHRVQSLGLEPLPDLYVAQFFFIESVPSSTQPSRNKSKQSEKSRPKSILAYNCLWCERWVGYTKEKARQHLLNDLKMKGIACKEPNCEWKTVRPSDLVRHMKLVHKKEQPTKKPGGAMQAGRSFKELQEAFTNGERAFPVDAVRSSLHVPSGGSIPIFAVDAQTPAYVEWTGSLPQFNHASLPSAVPDQVRTRPRTWYRTRWAWPVWSPTTLAVPLAVSVLGYSVHRRKPAELFDSAFELTSDAISIQTDSFLCFPVLSSVLSGTALTIPPHVQKCKNSENIPKKYPLLTNSSKQISYHSPSAHVLLRHALLEPKRRGLRPECHLDKLAPFLFLDVVSLHSCTYVPLSTPTLGNRVVVSAPYSVLLPPPIPPLELCHRRTVTVALMIQRQASAVANF